MSAIEQRNRATSGRNGVAVQGPHPLGTQAWVQRGGNAVPMPEAFNAPTVFPDHPRAKPKGGMWTSSHLGAHGSGWCQWCLDEGFAGPTFPLWTLTPDPDARVFTIATYGDLEVLVREYPHDRNRIGWRDLRPHWEHVARDFDAVHLTEDGQWETRLTHPLDLYGWDCESTLWLRWKFSGATSLGDVRCEAKS